MIVGLYGDCTGLPVIKLIAASEQVTGGGSVDCPAEGVDRKVGNPEVKLICWGVMVGRVTDRSVGMNIHADVTAEAVDKVNT